MSLEAAITENTNAIRELIAAIAKGVPTTAAQVAAVGAEANDGFAASPAEAEANARARAETKKAKATVAANGASSTSSTSPSTEAAAQKPAAGESATPAAASVSYENVKEAIKKLAQAKGRDQVVATLAKFGATNGPELKLEQYAEFVTAATSALGA